MKNKTIVLLLTLLFSLVGMSVTDDYIFTVTFYLLFGWGLAVIHAAINGGDNG